MDLLADLHELYAEFGMAAEKAQVLEVEAGNVGLTFMAAFMKPKNVTPEEREFFRSVIEDTNRQSLGKLLKVVKSLGSYEQSMLDAIDAALERRNYLIHHFFRSHNFAICSESGRKDMIEELRQIRRQLELALTLLTGITGTLAQLGGIEGAHEDIHEKHVAKGKRVEM